MNEMWLVVVITSLITFGVLIGSYFFIRNYKYALLPSWITTLIVGLMCYNAGKIKGFEGLGIFLVTAISVLSGIIASGIITVLYYKYQKQASLKPVGALQVIIYFILVMIPLVILKIIA